MTDRLKALIAKWREREQRLCHLADGDTPMYAKVRSAAADGIGRCADELEALLASPSVDPSPAPRSGGAPPPAQAKYRDRLLAAAYVFKAANDGSLAFLDECDTIMEEIDAAREWYVAELQRQIPSAPAGGASSPPPAALDLLREVIGDDDPRTFDEDEQWRETLDGKDEHDHVQIAVYAGTLRRILDAVRGPSWVGNTPSGGAFVEPTCEQHGTMVADDEGGYSWHCAVCDASAVMAKCEGCGAPATHQTTDEVDLCEACWREVPVSPATRESAGVHARAPEGKAGDIIERAANLHADIEAQAPNLRGQNTRAVRDAIEHHLRSAMRAASPAAPEGEPAKCETCKGAGVVEGTWNDDSPRVECPECNGDGMAEAEGEPAPASPKKPNPCPKCGTFLWSDPRPCWNCARLAGGAAPERHPFTPDSTGKFCATCGSSQFAPHGALGGAAPAPSGPAWRCTGCGLIWATGELAFACCTKKAEPLPAAPSGDQEPPKP